MNIERWKETSGFRRAMAVIGIFFYIGLAALLAFFAFKNLDVFKLQPWDEARHGVSAYEMMQTGDPIVTTYLYSPDYWNLKPPLSEYFQVLGYRLFGFNAMGLRFFSALFWLCSAGIAALFAKRHMGMIAGLAVLICFAMSTQPLAYHGVRTGDPDAYLFFAMTVAVVCMMAFDGVKSGWVYLACLAFAFGFLVKSWHAGIIALVVIIPILLTRRGRGWLILKRAVICFACALGPVLVWAAARYSRDGMTFFQKMVEVDLLRRSTTTVEGHYGTWRFYIDILMKDWGVRGALMLAVFGTILCKWDAHNQQILLVGWLGVLLPLVLFSCVTSKLVWYIYVVYPPLAILAGLGLQTLAEQCRTGPIGVALVLVALVVTGTCFYMGASTNMALVTGITPDAHDMMLAAVAENVEGRHNLYSVDGTWEQADAMVLEWTGKLTPCWGGPEAWEKDDDGLLLQFQRMVFQENDGFVTEGAGYVLTGHDD